MTPPVYVCVRASACVCVCAGHAQHAARNAFIEKNNMQLLLLLAVKEKYYTIHLSFALLPPSFPLSGYRLHAYYAQSQWAKFTARGKQQVKEPLHMLISPTVQPPSGRIFQGYCQAQVLEKTLPELNKFASCMRSEEF